MRIASLLVLLALGLGQALADDPPRYPRALIGHVKAVIRKASSSRGLAQSQLRPTPAPGIDQECFAGVGDSSWSTIWEGNYQPGQQIQIMVACQSATFPYSPDSVHSQQIETCYVLSDKLAFPVDVAWDGNFSPSSPSLPGTSSQPGDARW